MKNLNYCTVAAALAAGAFLLPSCKGNNQQQQMSAQAPEYAVLQVGTDNVSLNTAYPATLHGINDVEIRPQVTGFLTQVNVREGQHVNAGQLLFTIDQVQLQAAVDASKAAVEVAQANVNTAQTNANNNKILLDKNIISAPAYQTSVDALNAAKAKLNQARSNLVSAQKNLSYTSVTAPTAVVVGTIDNKTGSLVSPSTLLTILSDNNAIEAYFSMTEKEILALTDNGARSVNAAIASMPEVELQLSDGTIYPHKGKIISISGVLATATGSATVKASFPNPDAMLRSGNTGLILMPMTVQAALQIPQSATYDIQNMKFCYVVGDSSIVHSTPITVADQNDGKNYVVTSGLKPGDVIVVEGVGISVRDGMAITPKNPTQPQSTPNK
ncbi:MAG: efflux RND transporter periplasmic adaptor subunit [Muribaculaceae bacterium]|nr:efflux RND transporter periplasmic adaptor subunit [Muribaculaceae bacterium]